MTREESLKKAKALKKELLKRKLPIRQVLLFGSTAKGKTHKWSDIDIAVICDPFRPTRHEESVEVSMARWDIDLRIETICLHPEDLENNYSTIASEIKKYGIAV